MNFVYKAFSNFFFTIFHVLNEVKKLYTAEYPENDANLDPNVKTNMKCEWTENKNIKITLEIIIGSNGVGVFVMPNSFQPVQQTPPPTPPPPPPVPEPTIDEFQVEVDFGDGDDDESPPIVLSNNNRINNNDTISHLAESKTEEIATQEEIATEESPLNELTGERDIVNLIDIINQLSTRINNFCVDDLEFEDIPNLIDVEKTEDGDDEYNESMEILSVD